MLNQIRLLSRRYTTTRKVKVIKSANQSHQWIEIDCTGENEMYQILHNNPEIRSAFDRAIDMVPELKSVKDEMNLYMLNNGFMSKENPLVIDNRQQEAILADKKLKKLRSTMHQLLQKYGFLVPADSTEEPLNLFGPTGKRASVLQGSVPPRRIGMHTMLQSDYDKMIMEQLGFFDRLGYRIRSFFNKWMS